MSVSFPATARVEHEVGEASGEVRARRLPPAVVLGMQEGRRVFLHPASLAVVGLMVVVVLTLRDDGPRHAFELVSAMPTWFQGVATFFSAHLVASRDRRADGLEMLAPLPVSDAARTWAMVVAALVPAAFCAVLVAGVDRANRLQGLYLVPPDFWHLAQAPLTVLGAALLGLMVARCTALPGAPLLTMIVMVSTAAWLNARPTLQPLSTFVLWPVWGEADDVWHGMNPGSPAWHVAYLCSLCAMAAAGAFLAETRRRWIPLSVGALATTAAAVTGMLQLP